MPAVAPALRLPMVADDISTTADVLRFLQESLFALAKEGEATSPGAARGLYAIMGDQIARLDVISHEVTNGLV